MDVTVILNLHTTAANQKQSKQHDSQAFSAQWERGLLRELSREPSLPLFSESHRKFYLACILSKLIIVEYKAILLYEWQQADTQVHEIFCQMVEE